MKVEHYPYSVSAWWGGQLVARSDACLRVEELGAPPVLYFPLADIDLDRFEDQGRRDSTAWGETQLWSIAPTGVASASVDGHDILSSIVAPPPPLRELRGFGAFDQDGVRIEVTDGRPGDLARDVTVKRFPNWGDATDLIDVLNLRPDGAPHLCRRLLGVTGDGPSWRGVRCSGRRSSLPDDMPPDDGQYRPA